MYDEIKDDELYTLSDVSRIVGHHERYLIALKQMHPEYFEGINMRKLGTGYIISGSDVKKVLKQTKKEGDNQRNNVPWLSTKQTTTLLLPHFNLNIFQRLKSSEKFLLEIIRIFSILVYTNLMLV